MFERNLPIRSPYGAECSEGIKDKKPYGPSERSKAESTAVLLKISFFVYVYTHQKNIFSKLCTLASLVQTLKFVYIWSIIWMMIY